MNIHLLILLLLGALAHPLLAQIPSPTITIEVAPKVQVGAFLSGEGAITIRVTIPRNAQNRAVCLAIDGPLSRVSCYDHRGVEAAFRQEFRYRGLPAGTYLVVGELQWVGEEKGERKVTLARDKFVISGG